MPSDKDGDDHDLLDKKGSHDNSKGMHSKSSKSTILINVDSKG